MYSFALNTIRKIKFQYDNTDREQNSIKLFWFKGNTNFGDYLNYDLVSNLSQTKIEWVPTNYHDEYFTAIGSVLQAATDRTTVWGSGLIDNRLLPIKPPKEILAVRGPLTRNRLTNAKIKCPEIYGDPALIMPEIYNPQIEKKYDLGVIPHFIDKDNSFFLQNFNPNVKIIDIEQPNFDKFIDEVLSCKNIISSSLHGIIIADAYDIPALRVQFSNKVFGGDFKFDDYYASINRDSQRAIHIKKQTDINEIMQLNFNYKKKIDIRKLLQVNPFN